MLAGEAIPSLFRKSSLREPKCRSFRFPSFSVPDERGVVIWIEGADYIPAESSVR